MIKVYAALGFFDSSREDETAFCEMVKLADHEAEIAKLKEQLKEAEKVIEFYAENFVELEPNSGYAIFIVEEDKEEINGNLKAGKLARQYLAKKGGE